MSRFTRTIPADYFDELYARDADPWRFASSSYEAEKYTATLAALPHARYGSMLEIGCSIGVLTRRLAERARSLYAIDLSAQALADARRRCADLDNVKFALMNVPSQWPSGSFDLVVLSEVVYYLDRADVALLAARVRAAVRPSGDIVLVHWVGETHYPLTGDEAVEAFTASTVDWARPVSAVRHGSYRLDVFRASEAAQAGGGHG